MESSAKSFFYLIFVPSIAVILLGVMYVNSGTMQVMSSLQSMDEVMEQPLLPQANENKVMNGHDVEFRDVSFSYEGAGEILALDRVSFKAKR